MARARRGPVLAAAVVVLLAAVAAGVYIWSVAGHVAPGCNRLTAQRVGDVRVGGSACVHGVYEVGGVLAESNSSDAFRLSLIPPPGRDCGFVPGDDVVVRARGIFDDGRTLLGITDCR